MSRPLGPTIAAILRELDELIAERESLIAQVEALEESVKFGNRKRLSDRDVKDIRALHRKGIQQAEIATIYDVNPATVSRIVRRIYHG